MFLAVRVHGLAQAGFRVARTKAVRVVKVPQHAQDLEHALAVTLIVDERIHRRLQAFAELAVVGCERRFLVFVHRVVDEVTQLEQMLDLHRKAQIDELDVECM